MKTDIKSLLEFAGVDTSAGKAKQLVEMYSKESDLTNAIDNLEFENVFYHDGQIYVRNEITIGDKDFYWEWGEKDGYIVHHDADGNDISPEEKERTVQRLTELDPVKNSGEYDEEFEQIAELRQSYNTYRDKEETENMRGDYERDQRKDRKMENRFEDR